MAWIIGLIAVIGFAYLMYANEKFRRFGFGAIALVAAGIAVVWFLGEKQNRDFRAQIKREQTAISPYELALTDMRLRETSYGWAISGRVLNRSEHPLKTLVLTVYLRECPTSTTEEGCITTGQEDASFYIDVPAGQARDLNTTLQFSNAPILKPGWDWQFAIKQVEARLDDTP